MVYVCAALFEVRDLILGRLTTSFSTVEVGNSQTDFCLFTINKHLKEKDERRYVPTDGMCGKRILDTYKKRMVG